MNERKRIIFNDLDIKVRIGNLIINTLNINYEPPTAFWQIKNHCHSSYELHFIPRGKGLLRVYNDTYDLKSRY